MIPGVAPEFKLITKKTHCDAPAYEENREGIMQRSSENAFPSVYFLMISKYHSQLEIRQGLSFAPRGAKCIIRVTAQKCWHIATH